MFPTNVGRDRFSDPLMDDLRLSLIDQPLTRQNQPFRKEQLALQEFRGYSNDCS